MPDWRLAWLVPGRFYLELQRTGRDQEPEYLEAAVRMAAATAPGGGHQRRAVHHCGRLRATRPVPASRSRVLDDPRRPRRYSEQQYLKSPVEMRSSSPIAGQRGELVEIGARLNVRLELGRILAGFGAQGHESSSRPRRPELDRGSPRSHQAERPCEGSRLTGRARSRIRASRYGSPVTSHLRRLHDWAAPGVRGGPGRGSGPVRLVAWCLGITELDPMSRSPVRAFLNPERVSC